MTLTTDILRQQTNLSPKRKQTRKPEFVRRIKSVATKRKKVKSMIHIPGVSFTAKGDWRAYFYDGEHTHNIGCFATQERASIALRLFKYWRKCSFDDIPNKPSFRLYTKR